MARRALRPGELMPDPLGLHHLVPGWQRAIDAGEVADQADDAHPVATMAPGSTSPVYVSMAFVRGRLEALYHGHADPAGSVAEGLVRLGNGEVVSGWTAAYQLETARRVAELNDVPGLEAMANGRLPRHHSSASAMGTP